MAAKREELLKLAQSPEDRTLLSQFLDKQRQAERYVRPASTAFLDLRQQTLCRQAMQAAGVGGWSLEGGFAQAERRVALFLPDYIQEAGQLPEEDWPFRALRLEIRGQKPLTHRDYLGSLMGLGLRRETIGDILPGSQGADLLVMAEIAPYIQQNLTQVGSAPASVQLISLSELEIPEAKIKIIRDTVPSLRLDAVLAAAFSRSRGDAAEAVRRGLAQVDGAQVLKGDRPVAQGARLSIRGKGKAVLAETGGFSKKGRVNIEIHKLL